MPRLAMIVLNHADLILDETYLVSTETRGYVREPEESPFQPIPSSPPQPSEDEDLLPFLPDLIPLDHRDTGGGVAVDPCQFSAPSKPHQGREQLLVEMGHEGLRLRDLVHPALTDPLRNHQNSTFKLIKLISDFNYQLSKIHEQHATDMAHLVETFRKKTNEVQSAGPRCVNTIAIAWEQWRHSGRRPTRFRAQVQGASTRSPSPGSSGDIQEEDQRGSERRSKVRQHDR